MEAKIDRIAEGYAFLKLSSQQEIKLPVKLLPSGYQVGMRVWLKVETLSSSAVNQTGSLKDFLNEILKEDSMAS